MRDKIDFVILWVDGNDSKWKRRRAFFSPEEKDNVISENMKIARKLKKIMDSERTPNENWDFDGFGTL